jgi:hypothetical protein
MKRDLVPAQLATRSVTAPIQLSRKKAAKNPGVRWEGLNEFLAFADFKQLSPAQRAAWLAYWYASQVAMAGHQEYFRSPRRADGGEVEAALRAIGATEQAAILAAAFSAIRAAEARAPKGCFEGFVAGVEIADLTGFDEAFDHCKRSVPDCLLDYTSRHEREFIKWIA